MKKYQDLTRKVGKMWPVKKKVVQGWVGALGTIPLRLNNNLRTIEVGIPVEKIQRESARKDTTILPDWSPGNSVVSMI